MRGVEQLCPPYVIEVMQQGNLLERAALIKCDGCQVIVNDVKKS